MNTPLTIHVETKVLGRKAQQPGKWQLPLTFPDTQITELTLREVIAAVVRHDVEAFKERQAEQRLLRMLTPEAIEQGAEQGKILAGGRPLDQPVEVESAITTALQAFEDGLYFVFVDEVQQESLEQVVRLGENSHLLFVRLVALAGG